MTYYKVKKEADNKKRRDGNIYVADELYTVKEAEKLNINTNFVDVIEIPKSRIYWFFGCRFAN